MYLLSSTCPLSVHVLGFAGATSESEKGEAQRLPVWLMLSFGGLAGVAAQTMTYPLDVVRRQMQARL